MKALGLLAAAGALYALALPCGAASLGATDPERTLAPTFYVEGGDPTLDPMPLEATRADAVITGSIAEVAVTQTWVNQGSRPINATYVFPASTRAAVHGMALTIGDRVVKARVRERHKAFREYDEARRQGKSASLLEQQRPNVFSMSVANIMPGDVIRIELRYSEFLVPTEGTYEFVFPTVVGPRYSELTTATASDADTWVENPYLPEGTESPTEFDISVSLSAGMPIQQVSCPSHPTHAEWQGEDLVHLTLDRAEPTAGNRDFILRYRLRGREIATGLMLYQGPEESFFLLMAQPPERISQGDIPPREYIFVVDVSGSMRGFPLNTAKTLLRDLIGHLRPNDSFNVLLFSGSGKLMAERSLPATAANVGRALDLLERQRGGGGTRLLSAVSQALRLPHDENASRSLVVVTDGFIAAERDVFTWVRDHLGAANVFAFGIGSSVNRHLIEGLARAGLGEPFVVTEPSEAPSAAASFRDYILSPVLTNIQVDFHGFEAYDVEPVAVPDLMAERPVVVFGKWRGWPSGEIRLTGVTGNGPWETSFDVAATRPLDANEPIRYLWARSRIASLSDFGPEDEESVREVTSLGLTYNLLTQHTSFVAVDDVVRNSEGKATDVKQPLPLPQHVSNAAVGVTSAHKVPEPGLWLLVASLLAVLAGRACLRRRRGRA